MILHCPIRVQDEELHVLPDAVVQNSISSNAVAFHVFHLSQVEPAPNLLSQTIDQFQHSSHTPSVLASIPFQRHLVSEK